MKPRGLQRVSSYLVLTFGSLHNLHPGTSKLMKECTVSYVPSDRPRNGGP